MSFGLLLVFHVELGSPHNDKLNPLFESQVDLSNSVNYDQVQVL